MESDRLMLMEKLCKDGSLLLLFDGNATLRRKGEANYLIVAKDTKFYGLYGGDAEMYAIKTEKVSVICNQLVKFYKNILEQVFMENEMKAAIQVVFKDQNVFVVVDFL